MGSKLDIWASVLECCRLSQSAGPRMPCVSHNWEILNCKSPPSPGDGPRTGQEHLGNQLTTAWLQLALSSVRARILAGFRGLWLMLSWLWTGSRVQWSFVACCRLGRWLPMNEKHMAFNRSPFPTFWVRVADLTIENSILPPRLGSTSETEASERVFFLTPVEMVCGVFGCCGIVWGKLLLQPERELFEGVGSSGSRRGLSCLCFNSILM